MFKPLLLLTALTGTIAGGASVARASGEASGGAHHFVPLEPIEVPVIGSNRVEGRLHLKLVLGTEDAAEAEALSARLPELRAASVAATLEFSRLYVSGNAAVDAGLLRAKMTEALQSSHAGPWQLLVVEVAAQAA